MSLEAKPDCSTRKINSLSTNMHQAAYQIELIIKWRCWNAILDKYTVLL